MIRILSAALHVVLRRDMSLNRRLYAWLLGAKYTHRHSTYILMYQGSSHHVIYGILLNLERYSDHRSKEEDFDICPTVQECQVTL